MRWIKERLSALPHCYAVLGLPVEGRIQYLFAPDDYGPCLAFDPARGAAGRVWEQPGGTMSLVAAGDGDLLASQRFLPGFAARDAEILRFRWADGRWNAAPWLKLPYVHRFDLIECQGRTWFLGCILSGTDQPQAEWSNPGSLVAAPLDRSLNAPTTLTTIAGGMHRNHGYCRTTVCGEEWILTACDEGVFRVFPPCSGEAWRVVRLLDTAASDVAVADLDGDGKPEFLVIAPFHGDEAAIYREAGGAYQCVYQVPHQSSFLHAIWAGALGGQVVGLLGGRGGARELLCITCQNGQYRTRVVERGYGASNFFVCGSDILTANREAGECAVFHVEEDTL